MFKKLAGITITITVTGDQAEFVVMQCFFQQLGFMAGTAVIYIVPIPTVVLVIHLMNSECFLLRKNIFYKKKNGVKWSVIYCQMIVILKDLVSELHNNYNK